MNRFDKLRGKHVLFIGGSTGLGKVAAEGALQAGAVVTIASSSEAKLEASRKYLIEVVPGARIAKVVTDLRAVNVEDNLKSLLNAATKAHGTIHHIVYTAGDSFPLVPLSGMTDQVLLKAMHVRVMVPFILAKLVTQGTWLPKARSSSITFTGGNSGLKPITGFSIPSLIGSGMEGAVRSMAVELAPIRINIVAPGFVDTELWGDTASREKLSSKQDTMTLTARAGQAEDVVETYLYLMRDGNATGQTLRSEGGSLLLSREVDGR